VVPERLRGRVFRGTSAIRLGLLTANQLRGPAWRRMFRDVYAHTDVPVTHALRARAAATFVVRGSVVTGHSAAVLWGVDLVGEEEDVELTVARACHPRRIPGITVRRTALTADHIVRRAGVPVTTPAVTAVRLAGSLPEVDAVVAVDRFVAQRVVALDRIRAAAATAQGPGSARARAAIALADGLAASPQETRLRLLIGSSTLPPPVAQFVVHLDGCFVARVDFAWPERKVALEYDGLWHAEPDQFAKDRQRLNRLQAAGWRVVFVTAADMYDEAAIVAEIVRALAA
jgi:G:T-mismatch repair DNA endonuclease (very short patch repair protein)